MFGNEIFCKSSVSVLVQSFAGIIYMAIYEVYT